jgi:hypothetical protein
MRKRALESRSQVVIGLPNVRSPIPEHKRGVHRGAGWLLSSCSVEAAVICRVAETLVIFFLLKPGIN